MDPITLQPLLEFALDAAWQAGRLTLGYFQSGLKAERKADHSPVTIADQQTELKLRELINKYWPDHGIIGEEFGQKASSTNLTWLIDPIDGTKSFIAGVPIYGVLLALTDWKSPILGVAHFPALNETIYASRNHGCYWNGRRAQVSSTNSLKDAVLLASEIGGYVAHGKGDAWQRLIDATYFQRTWGDSYGYLLVATGRAEIMLDAVMNPWDCGPFQVILEEAGGTFTDWQGNPTIYAGESLATNGVLFDPVLQLIKNNGV